MRYYVRKLVRKYWCIHTYVVYISMYVGKVLVDCSRFISIFPHHMRNYTIIISKSKLFMSLCVEADSAESKFLDLCIYIHRYSHAFEYNSRVIVPVVVK